MEGRICFEYRSGLKPVPVCALYHTKPIFDFDYHNKLSNTPNNMSSRKRSNTYWSTNTLAPSVAICIARIICHRLSAAICFGRPICLYLSVEICIDRSICPYYLVYYLAIWMHSLRYNQVASVVSCMLTGLPNHWWTSERGGDGEVERGTEERVIILSL